MAIPILNLQYAMVMSEVFDQRLQITGLDNIHPSARCVKYYLHYIQLETGGLLQNAVQKSCLSPESMHSWSRIGSKEVDSSSS